MGVLGTFFRRKPSTEVDTLKLSVKDSFNRVSRDVTQLKAWVVHLHQNQGSIQEAQEGHVRLREQELLRISDRILNIENEQKMLAKYLSDLVEYLQKKNESESRFESRLDRFESELELASHRREKEFEPASSASSVRTKSEPESILVNKKSEPISSEDTAVFESANTSVRDNRPARKDNALEEKILQRFRAHRKDYILQKIVDIVENQEISTNDLEQIIVEEKGLCGRTSFFAYLKELRLKGILDDVLEKNKKIVILKKKYEKTREIQ